MTDQPLLSYVRPHGRFVRSVNLERDLASTTIESYLPTGRALDVVRRAARSLVEPSATRSFSVTGPYGSGKSSLAVFLDALLAPSADPSYSTALGSLSRTDPETVRLLEVGRERFRAHASGFVRGVTTAHREPVAATVLRALASGVERYRKADAPSRPLASLSTRLRKEVTSLDDRRSATPPPRLILDLLGEISTHAPILLLIDEFGKNLEAFADSRGEADLFLLQSLAEAAHDGDGGLPLVLVTMQHLAFEDYIDLGSVQQRREWAKIQGRFEDVPYVDTPAQTRSLISAVWDREVVTVQPELDAWARAQDEGLRRSALVGAVEKDVDLRSWWPLHPLTMLVLPELCARYGQNERTLFSFLASSEPLAVPNWLATEQAGMPLPDVRLDRVYDYFVDSASTMITASHSAARWLEVETAIRDAVGLQAVHRRVLKVVGLLNLISAGGSVRASRDVLLWALVDGQPGTDSEEAILEALDSLETQGRITWRDFADEYRIWRGTDIDVKGELELARRRARDLPAAGLLRAALPLGAVVAGQSTIESGTVRAFRREWADTTTASVTPPAWADPEAGALVYMLGEGLPQVDCGDVAVKPVVVAPLEGDALIASAVEVVAIRELLQFNETVADDVVARRELLEREAEATARLEADFREALDSATDHDWWVITGTEAAHRFDPGRNVSSALSQVASSAYPQTPPVRNELLNRHDLSSQGAKARREIVEAAVTRTHDERFGLDGFGPDRAIYEAVFRSTGMHVPSPEGWRIATPQRDSGWLPAWKFLYTTIRGSKTKRLGVDYLLESLQAPPFGMTAGAAPVLLVSVLLHAEGEVALYEHGTYKPRLAPDLCERLLRNPSHFQVKHFGADRGPRLRFLEVLAAELRLSAEHPSVLTVVRHLVTVVNGLPAYARATTRLPAQARLVRDAIMRATEPDALLFDVLPAAVEHEPVRAGRKSAEDDQVFRDLARAVCRSVDDLVAAYPSLLRSISQGVREACAAPIEELRKTLEVRASQVEGQVLDPKVRAFLTALRTSELGDQEWAEYVGMVVIGPPPTSWSDADELRFRSAVAELGGTFRRLEALHFDRRADDRQGFEAVRITLTRPDGSEHARVVTLEPAQREILTSLAQEALDSVAELLGGTTQAREALLALLAEQIEGVAPSVTAIEYQGDSNQGSGTDG